MDVIGPGSPGSIYLLLINYDKNKAGSTEAQRLIKDRLYGPHLGRQHHCYIFRCWLGPFSMALNPGNTLLHFRPELRQEHPLNLSISISGGKETNQDSPSNGE